MKTSYNGRFRIMGIWG